MNSTVVYSKTGKGLLEIKNRANRLSKDQYRVLNLVDGKSSLLDLVERARVSEVEARKIVNALSDAGYIKEVANQSFDLDGSNAPPIASYVDDIDFTSIAATQQLKPSFYQSALTEQRQREEADRKASEAAATKARAETDRRAKEEAQRKAAEEQAARKVREEAEQRAKQAQAREEQLARELRERAEAERRAKEEAARREQAEREAVERKAQEEVERRARIQAEARARVEAEKRARDEAIATAQREEEERKRRAEEERKRKEEEQLERRAEEERKRQEEEERQRRAEEERKRKEEEERKRRAEAERKRKEEEERTRRAEEERKRKEEEERKRREEAERKRQEEEERKRRAEEERKRKEEEERKRREEEERKRQEEEERQRRAEEERKRKEEEERMRRAEAERKRKEEEERTRRAEEERKRKEEERKRKEEERKRKEEERKRKEEEERKRREEEERKRKEEEERKRREEEERRRKEEEERQRRAEEERKRKEEEERKRREEEERLLSELEEKHRREQEALTRRLEEARHRNEQPAVVALAHDGDGDVIEEVSAEVDMLTVDLQALPEVSVSDGDIEALALAEAQVEQEFAAREEAIRNALEEQERRFRMEEEARTAMDRAEREARERADREARETALAAERASKDAEQRAREDAVQRAEQERDQRARDKVDRKKQTEDARKKRERDRHLAEQRAREEELARRRKEQDDADIRKSELDRLQRESRKRAFGPGRKLLLGGAVAAGLVVAAVQFTPLSAYAPAVERIASEAIGERVTIGSMRASMFPSLHVELEGVGIGDAEDIKAGKAIAFISLGSLFSDQKSVSKLVFESAVVSQGALQRLPRLLSPEGKSDNVQVERVEFKRTQLQIPGLELPTFDATVNLTPVRTVSSGRIETNDGHFVADVLPTEQGIEVNGRGMNFPLPLGPKLEIAQFTGKGLISGNQLRVSDLEYSVYGGQGKGELTASWSGPWTVEGSFDMQRVELEMAMKAIGVDLTSDGLLAAKGQYAMQSADLPGLFVNNPRLQSSFVLTQGNLSGLDLVRALQSPSREGVQGGKTTFEEVAGNVSLSNGRYQYSGVRIKAGAMNASGQLEIAPSRDVAGRAYVELRSTAGTIRSNFRIGGSTQAMLLRP